MEPIEEDMDKPLYPERLPNNPTLVTESFWNLRTQERETINHKLYRRLSMAGALGCGLSILGTIGGAVTGNWEIATAGFGIGVLLGKITTDISEAYSQKLRDAGHPFVKTHNIK